MSSRPRLIRAIPLGNWSGWIVRAGDLTGDGLPDFVFAQNPYLTQEISCITAVSFDGEVLWQAGEPAEENYCSTYDLAIQVHDWDGDGANEVVAVLGGELVVLDGATGARKASAPAPANDAIAFANLTGGDRSDLIVKDRYGEVFALDGDFRLLWSHKGNVGHYPIPYDVFDEGADCVLCGYQLLSPKGKVLWEFSADEHADSIDVRKGVFPGDDSPYAVVGNGGITLVEARTGRVRWRARVKEAQHVNFGKFRADRPGLQIVSVDRIPPRTRAGRALLRVHDAEGELLWEQDLGPGSWLAMSHAITWLGSERGEQIFLNRLGLAGPPRIIDGRGELVAELPMPHVYGRDGRWVERYRSVEPPTGSPFRSDFLVWPGHYGENDPYAEHNFGIKLDCYGDDRHEAIVYDRNFLYVYTNAAVRNLPHLSNQTMYTGPC